MPLILGANLNNIVIFDTALSSDNTGDEVIMEATDGILSDVFPDRRFTHIATHARMTSAERAQAVAAPFGIVGGTNILKSRMLFHQNWKLGARDFIALKNVILLGVGWQFYYGRPDIFSRWFFRRALARGFIHSVRDHYTREQLKDLVPEVLYTGCPTMWELDAAACARVPVAKAKHAVFSVTYYRPNIEADRTILKLLLDRYEKVYLWAQQDEDVPYFSELGLEGGILLDRSLAAYDKVLDTEDVDVLGSRLHGGIRALTKGRRALILEVDNRAREMAKETNLPSAKRDDFDRMADWVSGSAPLTITMPWDNIATWKGQFRERT